MDDLHKSIKENVDIYRDIRNISDHEVALLARKDGIDIAIDLQGYTDKHRVNIFANRAAPLQVNYLGYPGSMGVDFIDYIIADRNLIPDDNQKFFSEKIIFLPHQYQVQNNELQISEITPTKKDLGLPKIILFTAQSTIPTKYLQICLIFGCDYWEKLRKVSFGF